MSADPHPTSHRLPPSEHTRIFREEILADFAGAQPRDAPTAILLGGQPGIGKSSTKSALIAAMRDHGGVMDFSADLMRPYHPQFAQLLAGDERQLAALDADIDSDARAWVDLMIEHAVTNRLNAIVDSNLANPTRATEFIDRFAQAGYRVEVQFVAGPSALSRLGVLQRYQDQITQAGHGAYCPLPIQERNYSGVLDTAEMLDRSVSVDLVAVTRRGGTRLHQQTRVEGRWSPGPGARQAIEAERARPWTEQERNWYTRAAADLAASLTPDYLPDLHAACVLARPLCPTGHPPLEQLITRLEERIEHATQPGPESEPQRGQPASNSYAKGSAPAKLAGLGYSKPLSPGQTTASSRDTDQLRGTRTRQPGHDRASQDHQR